MSFFAKLTKVDLEALGADPTPIQGRFYLNTTTGMKWYDGGFWRVAVDTESLQDVRSKTLLETTVGDYLDFVEIATPANPSGSAHRMYAKADGNIYKKNSAGVETQVNGGGGGPASFLTKTSAYTAVLGDRIFAQSSGGSFTITLPASASNGDTIELYDPSNSWPINSVTVDRNGLLIEGFSDNLILSSGKKVVLVYFDATYGWGVY